MLAIHNLHQLPYFHLLDLQLPRRATSTLDGCSTAFHGADAPGAFSFLVHQVRVHRWPCAWFAGLQTYARTGSAPHTLQYTHSAHFLSALRNDDDCFNAEQREHNHSPSGTCEGKSGGWQQAKWYAFGHLQYGLIKSREPNNLEYLRIAAE